MENSNIHQNWVDPAKIGKLHNPQRLLTQPPHLIWEFLNPNNPDVVVDIGAGTGLFSIEFFKLMGSGTLYACDISEAMITWLTRNVHSEYPAIVPVAMSETAVPLADEIADFVFMMNLHHELKDPLILLREAKRLLKPDGKICIIDWKKGAVGRGPADSERYETEEVVRQLGAVGFAHPEIFEGVEFKFHFMVQAGKLK